MDLHNPCSGFFRVTSRENKLPVGWSKCGPGQAACHAASSAGGTPGSWREHGTLRETRRLHPSSLHCSAGDVITIPLRGLAATCVMSAESCLIKINRLLLLLSHSSSRFALVTLIFTFSPFALSCKFVQTRWLHTNIFVRNVGVVITSATVPV